MEKYIKIYMDFFGYQIAEDIVCEVSSRRAEAIHHIEGRGKGKDVIENLIAITNQLHHDTHFGRAPYTKSEFKEIHADFMRRNQKP